MVAGGSSMGPAPTTALSSHAAKPRMHLILVAPALPRGNCSLAL